MEGTGPAESRIAADELHRCYPANAAVVVVASRTDGWETVEPGQWRQV